jgi:hypothetical protein
MESHGVPANDDLAFDLGNQELARLRLRFDQIHGKTEGDVRASGVVIVDLDRESIVAR